MPTKKTSPIKAKTKKIANTGAKTILNKIMTDGWLGTSGTNGIGYSNPYEGTLTPLPEALLSRKLWDEMIGAKAPQGERHHAKLEELLKDPLFVKLLDGPARYNGSANTVLSGDKRYLISRFGNSDISLTEIAAQNGDLLPVNLWQTKTANHAGLIKKLSPEESRTIKHHSLQAAKIERIESLGIQIELGMNPGLTIYNETDFPTTTIDDVTDFAVDSVNPNRIYVAKESGLIVILDFDSRTGKPTKPPESDLFQLEKENKDDALRGICLDNQNNVLIATFWNVKGNFKTGIFAKTTGKRLHEIDGGGYGSPVITKDGTIITQQGDEPQQFKAFRTNLNSFDKGIVETAEEARKKEELLRKLTSEGLSDTEIAEALSKIVGSQREDVRDAMLPAEAPRKKDPRIEAEKNRITTMFMQEIAEAGSDIIKLRVVQRKIEALKGGAVNPVYAEFPEIFEFVEEAVAATIEDATLQTLREKLIGLKAQADKAEEYEEIKTLETEFSKTMSQRRRMKKEFNGEELEARKSLESLRERLQNKEAEI